MNRCWFLPAREQALRAPKPHRLAVIHVAKSAVIFAYQHFGAQKRRHDQEQFESTASKRRSVCISGIAAFTGDNPLCYSQSLFGQRCRFWILHSSQLVKSTGTIKISFPDQVGKFKGIGMEAKSINMDNVGKGIEEAIG
jgi:hypothetical protein